MGNKISSLFFGVEHDDKDSDIHRLWFYTTWPCSRGEMNHIFETTLGPCTLFVKKVGVLYLFSIKTD